MTDIIFRCDTCGGNYELVRECKKFSDENKRVCIDCCGCKIVIGKEHTPKAYNGEDMIGDDGYGTWDEKRLDEEYRKLKEENILLQEQLAGFVKKVKELEKDNKLKHDTTKPNPKWFDITELSDIPNNIGPFAHDCYHMGTTLGTNIMVMHETHPSKEMKYFILVNIETGKRIRIDFKKGENDGKV